MFVIFNGKFVQGFGVDSLEFGGKITGRHNPPLPEGGLGGWEGGALLIKNYINSPIFFFFKLDDFALPLHNQAHGHALHAPGGEATGHLFPQERGEFITH